MSSRGPALFVRSLSEAGTERTCVLRTDDARDYFRLRSDVQIPFDSLLLELSACTVAPIISPMDALA
eukprot:952476-Pleurochrysis_carterae.AAC.2